MKKFLASAIAAVSLAALVATLAPRTASAITSGPNGGAAQTSTLSLNWESLGVAAGAVITSPVFNTQFSTECVIAADNSAGGVSRTLNVAFIGADGTTTIYNQAITVTNGTRGVVQIGGESSAAATLISGISVMPVGLGRRMQFSLAAAGAAAGSLAVYCR